MNNSSIVTIDIRGRDLVIHPPQEWLHLSLEGLLEALFGSHLPATVQMGIEQDKRQHFLRVQPFYFSAVKEALQHQHIPFTVAFEECPALPYETTLALQPRPYQEEALTAWLDAQSAGVVVLPTGAGKTFVAAMAVHQTRLWTLAVVPTIDLLQQWRVSLAAALSLREEDIGVFGGGDKDVKAITVITYDSAAIYPRELRHFGLLIFDECHHLPALRIG